MQHRPLRPAAAKWDMTACQCGGWVPAPHRHPAAGFGVSGLGFLSLRAPEGERWSLFENERYGPHVNLGGPAWDSI